MIPFRSFILIEGYDQQTIIRPRPGGIRHQVLLQPAVALLDRAIVQVVVQIGSYPRDLRQIRVIRI